MKKIQFLATQNNSTNELELQILRNDAVQNITTEKYYYDPENPANDSKGNFLINCQGAFVGNCYSPQNQLSHRDIGSDILVSVYFQKENDNQFRLQILDDTASNVDGRLFKKYFEICIPNT